MYSILFLPGYWTRKQSTAEPELGPKVLQVAALAEAEREQAPIGGRVSGLGWFRVSGMYYQSRGTW